MTLTKRQRFAAVATTLLLNGGLLIFGSAPGTAHGREAIFWLFEVIAYDCAFVIIYIMKRLSHKSNLSAALQLILRWSMPVGLYWHAMIILVLYGPEFISVLIRIPIAAVQILIKLPICMILSSFDWCW